MQLNGQSALITGASSGIGRAAAVLFAQQGARLVVGARRQAELEVLVADITAAGGKAIAVAGDVCEESYARLLVDTALSEYGQLDIAFNNAGILGEAGDIGSLSLEGWQRTLDANLTGCFLGAKYQAPAMTARGRGSLIFTSSFVGHGVGMPGMSAYAASKAGIVGMMQCLAAELGPAGVRANALLPGGTDTAMADEFAADEVSKKAVAELHALKRIASAEEIARAALFLASDASSFMTGAAMVVDGGNSINKV